MTQKVIGFIRIFRVCLNIDASGNLKKLTFDKVTFYQVLNVLTKSLTTAPIQAEKSGNNDAFLFEHLGSYLHKLT